MEDYAPRSPDLPALHSQPSGSQEQFSYNYPPPPVRNESFTHASSSYYQPPQLSHQQSSTAFSHSSFDLPYAKLESQPSWQSQPDLPPVPQPLARRPGRPKRENSSQLAFVDHKADGTSNQLPAKINRKPSMKKERQPPHEPEPRPPAPGDEEGIVVRTKFPVARIKRIVQADEEVGKVAQSTPVSVGKALELFMIQMTLAAVAEVNARGSKRLTAQNVKAAISKDEKFDFLKDIGDKIPDGPSGAKERKPKAERGTSEEDVEMDGDHEPEAPKNARKRRKRVSRPADED